MAIQQTQQIFLDSSAFIAFIDRADSSHTRCIKIFELIARYNFRVYASNLVVFQTFSRLERDLGFSLARDFLKTILESNIQILYPTEADFTASYRFLKLNPGRQASLLEIVNAHLMDKNNIAAVLTFDYWHNLMGTTMSPLLQS